jgi:hypothetical protein
MAEPRILPCFLDISVHISTIVITGLIDQTIRPALFFVRLRATPSRLLYQFSMKLSLIRPPCSPPLPRGDAKGGG